MGGVSPEHPVSLVSGCGVLANLDPERYAGFPVLISKDHEWMWPTVGATQPSTPLRDRGLPLHSAPLQPADAEAIFKNPPADWHRVRFPHFTSFPKADIFFLGLHGVGGEDGRLQGFLEMAGQPFTGSASTGSALAMDKILSKQLYSLHGIPTAPWLILRAEEFGNAGADRVEKEIGLPCVVKHPSGGSSIGVVVVRTRHELLDSFKEIGGKARRLLVEAFLKGRESTCGVLEGFATALPPTEIRPKQDGFFSFEAKYQPGRTDEITPAEFPAEIISEIQSLARRCHEALQLSVYSRTDFIWTGSTGSPLASEIFALETNNLPGFTPTSILPQQAAKVGLNYRELVTHILEESRRR